MKFAFFFHFNKPATQTRRRVTISLHFRGKCHLVDNVVCNVPTEGRVRNASPRFVMAGKASEVIFDKDRAIIN